MKILFILPLPPPFAGPEIIASNFIKTKIFSENENLKIICGNINYSNTVKGSITIHGLKNFFILTLKFLFGLINTKIVFLYLSSSKIGFIKDSLFILCAKVLGKKVVCQYHGSNFLNFYNERNPYYKKFISLVLKQTDLILVLGECLRPIFQSINNKLSVDVLPNGINIEEIPEIVKIKQGNPFTIMFMGHLIFSKGFYDLIKAYQILFKKYGQNIALHFAGENVGYRKTTAEFLSGEYKQLFIEKGRQLDKEAQRFIENADQFNAKYLGFVSGERKWLELHKSSLFVLPSYTEGFSMAVLEAMAAGLPVIVTPVGAMPEIVRDGVNGSLTPVADPEKLAENMEYFIQHPETAQRIGNYNQMYVQQNFDIEIIAQKLLTLLNNV
ncbi:MAG: hypothetical protein Kow0037_14620 [Calditrichia bacterium]